MKNLNQAILKLYFTCEEISTLENDRTYRLVSVKKLRSSTQCSENERNLKKMVENSGKITNFQVSKNT